MIQESINKLLQVFVSDWREALSPCPIFALDRSWPSIGTLDQLTFLLRKQTKLNDAAEKVIKGSAAYIGVLVHDAWESAGAKVSFTDSDKGLTLSVQAGLHLKAGESAVFYVERDLKKLLEEAPNRIHMLSGFWRIVSTHDNHFSPFSLSLLMGLIPTAEGAWTEQTPDSMSAFIEGVVKYLAQSAADYYARLHPDEPLGQVPELYLRQLIYPPMLYKEEFAARQAAKGLQAFLREYNVPRIKVQELSYNLAFSPDELISSCGFVFYSATLSAVPSPEFLALAHSKGTFIGVLRRAMYDVRKSMGLSEDWLEAKEFSEQQIQRIGVEQRLGFIPWLRMSKEKVVSADGDNKLMALIRELSLFNLQAAKNLAQEIIDDSPADIEVQVQRVYLDIIEGDVDRAENRAKNLLSEPEAEAEPGVHNLLGLIQLVNQKYDEAISSLNRARMLPARDQVLASDISNNYAWALMCASRVDDALDSLELSLKSNPKNLVAFLNKASLLNATGKSEQAEMLYKELLRLAPLDRRVFHSLIHSKWLAGLEVF